MLLVSVCLLTAGERTSIAQDKELSESTDFRVRVQAALRLGRAGGRQSRADLEKGLRDVHPAVRVACAVSLGNIGDKESIPALEQAVRTESFASAKQSMKENIDKIRSGGAKGGGAAGAPTDPVTGVERAKYVVQLGTMRNNTGQRADLDTMMRETAKSKASTIKGAVVLDAADETVLRRAGERKIPVLVVDGNLTKLSQTQGRDGGVTVSAQVDFSIRTAKQQLKGMVSGNAMASDNSMRGLTELQNRAVHGAVESAMASVSSEIVALSK